MTYEQQNQITGLIVILVFFCLYLLRNINPFFKGLWRIISIFFIVLFVTLSANYAKDKIKDWWNK